MNSKYENRRIISQYLGKIKPRRALAGAAMRTRFRRRRYRPSAFSLRSCGGRVYRTHGCVNSAPLYQFNYTNKFYPFNPGCDNVTHIGVLLSTAVWLTVFERDVAASFVPLVTMADQGAIAPEAKHDMTREPDR